MPELPMPAIALPMINIVDEVAEPQTADPISKMRKKTIRVHYTKTHKLMPWRGCKALTNFNVELGIYLACQWLTGRAWTASVFN